MKPSFNPFVLLAYATLSLASPTPQETAAPLKFTNDQIQGRSEAIVSPLLAPRSLPPQVCNKIKGLVSLLKVKSATPFCSSFLAIQTSTTTVSTSVTGTETTTTTIFSTLTSTVVASTETLEFSTTLITGTERNTVATETNSVTTITIRPFTLSTVTATTTYVPAAAKRELVERAIKLPGWLVGFASAAVSTACQCLDIPTPTATDTFTASFTNTEIVTERPTITEYSSITTTTSTTETIQQATTTPYTYTTVVTTTVTSSTAVLTVTSTQIVTLPTPALCKNPTLYNGLRPRDFAPLITHDYGAIGNEECCMKCFVLPGCIAWVRNSGSQPCLGLTVASNRYPNQPPTQRCPWGVGDTIFGTAGIGAVGKGPCDNLGEWN